MRPDRRRALQQKRAATPPMPVDPRLIAAARAETARVYGATSPEWENTEASAAEILTAARQLIRDAAARAA